LSEVGTHHWLPLLPDMDSEEEEEPTGAATAVPSTVPYACWNRLLTAATVCGAELPLLERCGAPALLSCAAQVETAAAGPSLFTTPPELAAEVTNQMEAAAEAFRAGVEHLPYLTEQGLSSPDTAKHDAAKSPEVLLHELLQDELAQVSRSRDGIRKYVPCGS
jgi:imidazolonepropionase-like amidohydrolase